MCLRLLIAACLCLIGSACTDNDSDATPVPPPTSQSSQTAVATDTQESPRFECTASQADSLHSVERSVERVAVDDKSPGIVAWQSGSSLYSLPTLSGQPANPTSYDLDLPSEALLMAARLAEGSLLITSAQCVTDAVSHPCLTGYYLPDGGNSISRSRIGLPASPINGKRTRSPFGVYLAHAYDNARITLTSFTIDDAGALTSTQRPLGQEIRPTEEPVEVLAITAKNDRWVTLWRFGAEGSPTGETVLSLEDSESPASLLRHAISIDTMLWRRASIMIVAGFEFARPALFRIATNGRIRWLPRAIPHEGHLPEPYHQRYNARLVPNQTGPHLEITSAAGDPLSMTGPFGDRWTLENRLVSTSRNEAGFAVAYVTNTDEEQRISISRVRCAVAEP